MRIWIWIPGRRAPKTAIFYLTPNYTPPPRPLLRAHFLVAVALFMLYLGQNLAWLWGKILNRVFESTNYTHENTGAGHTFQSTIDKCEYIPKPPYLSGIVTYEEDHTAIFRGNFAQIHFSFSTIFFVLIFISNFHDDAMITSRQQASSLGLRCICKIFLRPTNRSLKKLVMTNHHLGVFIQHDPSELRGL
jgi:hypothetical protein